MIQIYNTLSRKKEVFEPMTPGQVRLYVCGMTVYDYCHIGHARVMVVFDVVCRYLRYRGYDVTYVRNITDIDDKIINRAIDNGESIGKLTERFIAAMHEDAAALKTLPPDSEPRATDNIDAITAMVSELIKRGHAYAADNGDVYFAVNSFENYGRLSGRQLDDMRAGERVEVDPNKRDPMDFVLWKAAKPGEPAWSSPWGEGRPGWHIECSAMSTRCLGNHFDIHGGGMDLQFPHHENEIAQSECATGETFVNIWMHNGFVRINDEKMSKSLGNFFTIRDVMENYRGEEIRFFMLGSHYRSPLNYSLAQLDQARAGLTRLYTALQDVPAAAENTAPAADWVARFESVMDDDFNTAEALAVLFDLAGELNKAEACDKPALAATLRALGATLGLLQDEPASYLRAAPGVAGGPSDEEIEALIAQRSEARANKDFAESDRIRDLLAEQGIVLEDKDGKTGWRRKA
ncbi:cysteine--tRNA ligase [Granulosicoccaceae sp. 1_MG-2023]|nr:cysteine--tRNA ligase [Granulosicoccaceae sp. 1_MG-2023]